MQGCWVPQRKCLPGSKLPAGSRAAYLPSVLAGLLIIILMVPQRVGRWFGGAGGEATQVPKKGEKNPKLEPRPQFSFPALLTKHNVARNGEFETQRLLKSCP